MSNIAIKVEKVSKFYKLYDKPSDRLKEALHLTRKKFKEHKALDEVSFEIKKGESIGIIGVNGSGKSTILKIITGVLQQTCGNVEVDGRISALLELGAGFNMEYTGIENVYLNGSMIGFTKEEIDAKLGDILEFADIGDFVYQPVKTYSSGMFVRLAFAVAINIEPEILIVDEALSVGDVFFQTKCYKKFEEFKERGKTIVFVSHDLGSINRYCDRVIVLNKGVKVSEGSPKEMINIYKKIMVNQLEENAVNGNQIISKDSKNMIDKNMWKSKIEINPDLSEYGNKKCEIFDFGVFDENDNITTSVETNEEFSIKLKIKFNEEIKNPIFAYAFKDVKGTTITGTNTMYLKNSLEVGKPGEEIIVCFKQTMNLAGGSYVISLGCTGYEGNDFVAYHRLYDVVSIAVLADKYVDGYYGMDTVVEYKK